MAFKLKKLLKRAGQAYLTYQTGGLSAVAMQAGKSGLKSQMRRLSGGKAVMPGGAPLSLDGGMSMTAISRGGGMAGMGALPAVGAGALQIGKRVNWPRLWNAVKVLGIGAVATALNVEVGTLAAQLIAHPRKRRRKGLTAANLRNARRTNRIILNWSKQLHLSPRAAPRRTCK